MKTVTVKALIDFEYQGRSLHAGQYDDRVTVTDAIVLARQGLVSLTRPGRGERVTAAAVAEHPDVDPPPSQVDAPALAAVVDEAAEEAGSPPRRRRGRRRGAYQRRDLIAEPSIE